MPRINKLRNELGEKAYQEVVRKRAYEKVLRYRRKNKEKVSEWRKKAKQELIQYAGGKCCECGYDKTKFVSAFCFHHLDPSKKEFGLADGIKAMARMKAEADKCILLCVRCHAEIHDEMRYSGQSGKVQ